MKVEASPPPPGAPSRHRGFWDATLQALTGWFALTLAIAVAPGLAMWPLAHLDDIDFVVQNKLDVDQRHDVLEFMALSAVCVLAFYIGAHLWMRARAPGASFRVTCMQINRHAFITLSLPFLVGMMHPGIENDRPFVTLLLAAVVTAMFAVFLYRAHRPGPGAPSHLPPTTAAKATRVAPKHWIALALIGLFYACTMSFLAVLDHRNLGTHIYDLGIYDNVFWNTAFEDFLGCSYCKLEKHISAHFDPIIYIFSPIYRLWPQAQTILILQSTWLATGVVPLFLLAQRKFGDPRLSLVLCGVYVLYPALHGVNMFDFHSLTMVVPSVMWVLYFIDSGARIKLAFALALMLLTREDMSLLACFLGAYAMLRGRHVTGLVMVFASLSYLAVVKLFVMPDPGLLMSSPGTYGYTYFFDEMIPHPEQGVRGFVISLLTNPVYALQVLFKEGRVFFFLVLLQPLLFLPLLAGKKRFIMIYGLMFLGLASRKHVFDLHFQYSSVLFPVLVASVPDGIASLTRSRLVDLFALDRVRVPRVIVWTMLVSTLLVTVKYGGMVPNAHFKAGWNRPHWGYEKERYEYLQKVIEQIPPDVPVCATSSLGPHVSNRARSHKWPACKDSQYALLFSSHFGKKDKTRVDRAVKQGRLEKLAGKHGIELFAVRSAAPKKPASEDVPDDDTPATERRAPTRSTAPGGGAVMGGDTGDVPEGEGHFQPPEDMEQQENPAQE